MENNKSFTPFLTTLLIVLSLALVVLVYLYFSMKNENEATIQQLREYSSFVEAKKDSLESELKSIIVQYDSLKTNNDSMNIQIEAQQDKIKRLLSLRLDDAQKIRTYEKELSTIRLVLRSYIVQIDSLNTRNQLLTVENKELKNKHTVLETRNQQLAKDKEQLLTITTEAKALVASGISVVPLNKRSKEQEKSDKVVKIRVDFTLRKNNIAESGPRTIYLRLIRPDNLVLASSANDVFDFKKEKLPFSARREVNYENTDLPVSIFWDNNGDLVKGNYKAELYSAGFLIGEISFTLR